MLALPHPSAPPHIYPGMDASGTINPAALNSSSTVTPNLLSPPQPPRGTKRSRSPDAQSLAQGQEVDFDTGSASKRSRSSHGAAQPVQTPQAMTQPSPGQSSPSSASKPAVVKALPTVRDHTTDQLGPEGDEYIPRETDPEGEAKVSKDGYALDGRKYKCRTFTVPNRGEKLFMLATECARVLGYRDSYLLFNKNRSLFKIIASQAEKDNLIHQEILPYSYRSRQIAIVTARSMFRQFGSRLIEGGRRVRDDYWEAKARKQGFTEEDAAGEKRPGAAKAREAAAAEASQAATNAITSLPQGEIIYNNRPGIDGQPPPLQPSSLAPLSMIHIPGDDRHAFGGAIRPRQEMAGPPYQDRTQSSNVGEILTQAQNAAEYNKQLGQTRAHRANYLDDYWRRPHEQPVSEAAPEGQAIGTIAPQNLQSPQAVTGMPPARQEPPMSHGAQQMLPQGYPGYANQQNPSQSPVQGMHRQLQPTQMHQGSPMAMGGGHRQTPSYGYPNQMWQTPQPQPQPQPSPLAQHHQMQYGQHGQMAPPPHGMAQPPGMGYGQMGQMNPAFAAMNRNMYQTSPNPQQFNMVPQGGAGQQPGGGMQGWSNPGQNMAQDWQRYQ